jgi:hypothetical protein
MFPLPRLRPAPQEVWDLVGVSKPTHFTARASIAHRGKTGKRPSAEVPAGFPLYAFLSQKAPSAGDAR